MKVIVGRQIGWDPVQSPGTFSICPMCLILFVFALAIPVQVFEINIFFPRAVAYINRRYGYSKAFFSACWWSSWPHRTALFMGTAIELFRQHLAFVNLLIFTFLGLGPGVSFLILRVPSNLEVRPQAGPSMKTFKKFLALIDRVTILWLVWVLSYVARYPIPAKQAQKDATCDQWLDYSPELMSRLAREGKTVFLDFTAKWVHQLPGQRAWPWINREVADKFRKLGVAGGQGGLDALRWAHHRCLGRAWENSIPVYVLYSGENHRDMKGLAGNYYAGDCFGSVGEYTKNLSGD